MTATCSSRYGPAIFLAYESATDHRRLQQLRRRHEPLSYTDKISADEEFLVALNGGRMASIAVIQSRMPSYDENASEPNTSLPMLVGTSSSCEPAVWARNAG